jgi:hypothetical protein
MTELDAQLDAHLDAAALTREAFWARFTARHLHIARLVRDQLPTDSLHSPALEVKLQLLGDGQLSVTADTHALHEYLTRRLIEALPGIVEAVLDGTYAADELAYAARSASPLASAPPPAAPATPAAPAAQNAPLDPRPGFPPGGASERAP